MITVPAGPSSNASIFLDNSTNLANSSDRHDFISLTTAYFEAIVADHDYREKAYKELSPSQDTAKAITLLSKGIWYPRDYYDALKKFNQQKRLEWLVERCAFFHGLAPTKFFSCVQDPASFSEYKMMSFVIKDDIRPSDALDNLDATMSLLDCGTACYLAASRALRDLLTPEKFDALFAANSPRRFCLSFNRDSSLDCLFDQVFIKSESQIKKGDICHFSSIVDYVPKHPAGEARGYNVLCIDEGKKTYLGLGLPPLGANKQQIEQQLFDSYNADPIEEGIFPPSLWSKLFSGSLLCNEHKSRLLVQSLKSHKLTRTKFDNEPSISKIMHGQRTDGKLDLCVWRPNCERIQQLIQAPLEEIGDVFAHFKKPSKRPI